MQRKDYGRTAIFGASGSGKSTLARQMLQALAKDLGQERVIIFDVMHEYSGQVVETPLDLVKAIRAGWETGFRVVYQPEKFTDKETQLNNIAMLLFNVQAPYKAEKWDKPIFLVVEEMSLCYGVLQRPADKDGFGELCATGRHYGIFPIGISQRPAETGNKFRGNTSVTYVFRQASHADLAYFRSGYGPQVANQLSDLPNHECLKIECGEVQRIKNAA